MIPLKLAKQLKDAGLVWQTQNNDFFGIPDRGMDERAFVLADIMANVELLQGWPVVAFHGAAEWALDHIYTSEIVWLPSEEQVREALAGALDASAGDGLTLARIDGSYRCIFRYDGLEQQFEAETGVEAYGYGLLYVLQAQNGGDGV